MSQLSAGSFEHHLVAGGEHLRCNRVEEALVEFKAALGLRSDDPKALGLIGLAYFRQNDFTNAAPVYEELVRVAPTDASHWLNLGLVHLKLGDATRAIAELSRSRELDPSQARTVSYLGLALARNGEYAQAFEAFLQAGQTELANEMAEHLSNDERETIAERVSGRQPRPASPSTVDAETADASETSAVEADGDVEADDLPEQAAAAVGAVLSDEEVVDDEEPLAPPPDDDDAAFEETGFEEPAPAPEPIAALALAPATDTPRGAREQVLARAVEDALPSAAVQRASKRTAEGHRPPQPLSEFATERLIRPEDGDHAFEISADGLLIVRVRQRIMSRTGGVIVSGGDLGYEPAERRVRGAPTGEIFGGDEPLFNVTGNGHMVAAPHGCQFKAVDLDDDILYLREDLVYAFEENLRWESGHVPGSESRIRVVQFRGEGCVAIRTRHSLLSVKLASDGVLYVDQEMLAGWVGRVIPRLVAPTAGGDSSTPFVECTGEGIVLISHDGTVDAPEPV